MWPQWIWICFPSLLHPDKDRPYRLPYIQACCPNAIASDQGIHFTVNEKSNKTTTGSITYPIIWKQLDLQNTVMSCARRSLQPRDKTCQVRLHSWRIPWMFCFFCSQNMGSGGANGWKRVWHLQEFNLIIHLQKFYTFSFHNSVCYSLALKFCLQGRG